MHLAVVWRPPMVPHAAAGGASVQGVPGVVVEPHREVLQAVVAADLHGLHVEHAH